MFATAVAKNAPRTECKLSPEQLLALCVSVLRPRMEEICEDVITSNMKGRIV